MYDGWHDPERTTTFLPVRQRSTRHFHIARYRSRTVELSVYALWHEVVQLLRYAAFKSASAQQLLTHFSIALTTSDVAEKWLGKGRPRLTVGAALQSLSQRLSFKPREFSKKAIALADSPMNIEGRHPPFAEPDQKDGSHKGCQKRDAQCSDYHGRLRFFS